MAAKPEVLITSLVLQTETSFQRQNLGYKASRMCATSTDSGRHHCMLNMQNGGQ